MKKNSVFRVNAVSSLLSSLAAILVGLLFGFIVLLASNTNNALAGLGIILKGGFTTGAKGLGQVLYNATPIIFTGLSVAFAFKTGLFNIGASGQFMVGGLCSIIAGVTMDFLGPFHWVAAFIIGIAGGALWGLVPGLLKALFNVNEVITSIMMNYIGLYFTNYMVLNLKVFNPETQQNALLIYDRMKNQTVDVASTAVLPKAGLDNVFYNTVGKMKDVSSVNSGIFIALLIAIIIYVLLNKTTFGYELKASGFNKHASKYAGINENRTIISSMVIAGALAGAGGAAVYLAPSTGMHIHIMEVLAPQGFNGIPVALLALSHPIGVIFSGLFIAHITVGGINLQQLGYLKEIIDIIVGVIIYFSAFSLLIKGFLGRRFLRKSAKSAAADQGKEEPPSPTPSTAKGDEQL